MMRVRNVEKRDRTFCKAKEPLMLRLIQGKVKNSPLFENGKFQGGRLRADHPIWAIIDPLLGRTSDTKLGLFFGIPDASIENRRVFLRILPYEHVDYELIDPLLDLGTDEAIADLFDGFIDINAITDRRKKLGKGFFVVKKQ